MKIDGKLQVVYTREAHHKMYAYARAAKGEVTGFGQVHLKDGYLYVDDVYIVPQKATGAGVHVDADTLHEFMAWCRKTKRPDRLNNLKMWWHSHVDMQCFRSGTDQKTCELLLQVMPWLLCVVVNKKGQHETTIHLKDPARMTFMRPKVIVQDAPYGEWNKQCISEVNTMVSEWKHTTIPEPVKNIPVKVYSPMIMPLPYAGEHDYHPPLWQDDTPEDLYLRSLERKPEAQWDRYKREKGLYIPEDKSAFLTDGKTDDEIKQMPFGAMTTSQFERYAIMHEPEPLEANNTDGDTKRYIVEEGQVRPERTSDR